MYSRRFLHIALGVSLLLLPASGLAADYAVTEIGTLGGNSVTAWNINNGGIVVGQSDVLTGESFHAFVYEMATTDLGALADHPQSVAFGINNSGQIVGSAYTLGEVVGRAVLWTEGILTELGDFSARDINDAGLVVGTTLIETAGLSAVPRAVRWDGSMLILGTLGGDQSQALAVNEAGWIVGGSGLSDVGVTHGFVWINGLMHDLGTLGGDYSFAYDINDVGQVVGISKTSAGTMHAFMLTVDGNGNVSGKTDLGELGGGYSAAYGVNASSQAVGTSDNAAILWDDGTLTDLNTLIPSDSGWHLQRAMAINNAGQIVGEGRHMGIARAFLLTPITPCEGDANGDGVVDPLDSGYVLSRFGCLVGSGDPGCDAADVNGDDVVDPLDVGYVLARFGTCE